MYDYISGLLKIRQPNLIVIENNGIGYHLKISFTTYQQLPATDQEVKLYTHLHVREDIFDLYGFMMQEERDFFHRLIAISKVGPKAALAILSGGTPAEISDWILTEDVKALSRVPGIGPTTAKRIILELKSKLQKSMDSGSDYSSATVPTIVSNASEEAMLALEALGYARSDVYKKIRDITKEDQDISTEQLVKKVLQRG